MQIHQVVVNSPWVPPTAPTPLLAEFEPAPPDVAGDAVEPIGNPDSDGVVVGA